MATILGRGAINEDKFTSWNSRQRVLGLLFDTEAFDKAKARVQAALAASYPVDPTTAPCLVAFGMWLRVCDPLDLSSSALPTGASTSPATTGAPSAAMTADLIWWPAFSNRLS
ncbi:hypothetical protein GQ600_26615 [Phytophthora cactorum]|nr:hypothetical protein GQ600_26615 [Phytophthora cactorum]